MIKDLTPYALLCNTTAFTQAGPLQTCTGYDPSGMHAEATGYDLPDMNVEVPGYDLPDTSRHCSHQTSPRHSVAFLKKPSPADQHHTPVHRTALKVIAPRNESLHAPLTPSVPPLPSIPEQR